MSKEDPTRQAEDLKRLRRENNRLRRRLQEAESALAEQERRERRNVESLRGDLAAMRQSRAWRAATCLRRLWPRRTRRVGETDGGGNSPGGERRARQYERYLEARALTPERLEALSARQRCLARKPLISVVMPVYNPVPEHLDAAVASVTRQVYREWELCIVDDASDRPGVGERIRGLSHPRIRTARMERNSDIAAATNEAIALSSGEYIAFMDHDDEIPPDALLEIAAVINESNPDFIYTDEDYIDPAGRRANPHFKPDYSPDLLLSHNYITHLVVVRRDLLRLTGGLRTELDGAQDYDFVLRATELAERICHLPQVLYHWRMSGTSTSYDANSKPMAAERGREAVRAALERRGYGDAEVLEANIPHFYRVRYPIRNRPLVSIVIPFKDKPELLHYIVGDILEKSTYEHYEVVGVSNNSVEPETFDAMRDLSGLDGRIRFLRHDVPFSFSAVANFGVRGCAGQHVVLLNNDIRLISAGWIEAMLEHSQRPDVGAVGGKLYYPDQRVQHAGVIVGIGGYAGHSHKGFPGRHQGYFNRLQLIQNVSAVTGAFMMVKKELYDSLGGFDEHSFAVACNDVDFCLRLREKGYWNVFTPYAEAWHLESASRGYEDTPEKEARFAGERRLFSERHRGVMEAGDPFYNPNLTRASEDFSLAVPEG